MQIVSAYLLAASAVDSGNYDEYYDLDIDPLFEEYMELGGDDIIGEEIELTPPNNGTGSFSGAAFCADWISAFTLPIEIGKIYAEKAGLSIDFLDSSDSGQWGGYILPFEWQTESMNDILIPRWLDNDVYQNTGRHINVWFASLTLGDTTPAYADTVAYNIAGINLPSNIGWRLISNMPTQGYGVFEVNSDVYMSTYTATNRDAHYVVQGGVIGKRRKTDGTWFSGGLRTLQTFIMVYNPKVFLAYLNRLDAETIKSVLSAKEIILAECNVSKGKR